MESLSDLRGGNSLRTTLKQQRRGVRVCESRREHSLSAVPCQTSFWCVHWSLICSVVLWVQRESLILQLAHVYTIRRLWCVITVYDATVKICTRDSSIWYKSCVNYQTHDFWEVLYSESMKREKELETTGDPVLLLKCWCAPQTRRFILL